MLYYIVKGKGDIMNKIDLLYNAIDNYFALQSVNSFCLEAVMESDIDDSHKIPFDIFSNLKSLFKSTPDEIQKACDDIKIFSLLNINTLVETLMHKLDDEESTSFFQCAKECIKKNCDEDDNFLFTTDAYRDIMNMYWDFERKSINRRFNNGNKK